MSKKTLITFDIDGTICVSQGAEAKQANALHTNAFNHAFKTVFGVDASIDEVMMSRGLSKDEVAPKLPEMAAAMVSYAEEHKSEAGQGLALLPGVEATLKALHKRDDVLVGLVTGNLQPIAWLKMEALGISHYFSNPRFGGFGSDFCGFDPEKRASDRAELVRRAASKAQGLHPGWDDCERYHIGDAPADVEAAEEGGATAVGVATGVFTEQELREHMKGGKSVILSNLEDTDQVLKAFGLE